MVYTSEYFVNLLNDALKGVSFNKFTKSLLVSDPWRIKMGHF
jgi:hypothetical protein